MNRSVGQLERVYQLREDNAQKRLRQRREALAHVTAGLDGADALQAALLARLSAHADAVVCAADLVERHEHTRRVGQQLQEIERLKVRAQANQAALRDEVSVLGAHWRKAQARTAQTQRMLIDERRNLRITAQLDEEEQVLERWLTVQSVARARVKGMRSASKSRS